MAGFIQGASAAFDSASSGALTFAGPVTLGSSLVAIIRYGGTADNLSSLSDSINSAYTLPVRKLDTNIGVLYMAYFQNTAAGSPTVTVSFSAPATLRWAILEYGGCATSGVLDTSNSIAIDVDTGSPATAQATTLNGNDILISALATNVGSGTVSEDASGLWTQRFAIATSKLVISDRVVSSNGTYNDAYTDTLATETYISGIMALKVAGAKNPWTKASGQTTSWTKATAPSTTWTPASVSGGSWTKQ